MSLERFLLSKNSFDSCLSVLIGLLAFGFPLVAYISTTLGLPSTPIAITFRAILLALAFFLFLVGITKSESKFTWPFLFLVIFWTIYSFRLIWDVSFLDIEREAKYTPFYLYSFAFGNSFIPILTVGLLGRNLDLSKFIKISIIILAFQGLLTTLLLYRDFGFNLQSFFMRQIIISDGGAVLNPITISRTGGLLFIITIFQLMIFKNSAIIRVVLTLILIMSLYLLVAGGSRGPILAAVTTLLLILLYYFKVKKIKGVFKLSFLLIPIVYLITKVFSTLNIEARDIAIIGRIEGTINNETEEVRTVMWRSAWNQFLEHPILGDQFLERTFHFYPHNLILESLMSVGALGSFFLFTAILSLFIASFRAFKKNQSLYFLLTLIIFFSLVGYMTSGSIYLGVELWAILALALIVKAERNYVTV